MVIAPPPRLQDLRDPLHDADHLRLRLGRADVEHAEIGVVGEADHHALAGLLDRDARDAESALVSFSIASESCRRELRASASCS